MTEQAPSARGAAAGRWLGLALAPTLFDARRRNIHLVPKTGPVVLVSNHTAFLDGPLVYCLAPRPVHFLVKRSYFDTPLGVLLRGVGQIPIAQQTGDRAALQAARGVLKDGGVVGIFPEGTRGSGAVETARHGAAYLALQTGAQVVPIACLGTRGTKGKGSWPRPRAHLEVVFGEPFRLDTDLSGPGRERLRVATDLLRTRLQQHVTRAVADTGLALPINPPASA